jgi:DNA topoisomerase-1
MASRGHAPRPSDGDDPEVVAEGAGLHYATDDRPGITRRRAGSGFSYRAPDGATIRSADRRARIEALAVPPAWTDVWINPDPLGHLQATGRDQRGRKQYRYHPRWRQVRDADKFDALLAFGLDLGDLRAHLDRDLRRPGLPPQRVLALVVRLLDDTLVRVGNTEYASDNDTYGLTTMRRRHVEVSPARAVFAFKGKSGIDHEITVTDRRLARLVARCREIGGYDLFTYVDEDDRPVPVTSSAVNDYLRAVTGRDVTAKDFRTWGGTVVATDTLAQLGPADTERAVEANVLTAVDQAAEALRNTRTVCRNCYIHPAVVESYRKGELDDHWRRSRTSGRLSRAERTTRSILEAASDHAARNHAASNAA